MKVGVMAPSPCPKYKRKPNGREAKYMSRFKNYGLWVALFALGGLIVNDFGLLAPEQYDQYVAAILSILVAAGVVSNPSIGKGFIDKGEKDGDA
jgi:uncharacterized membrane protein